jgi:pimeloyl-ACP methyl ester carboxylesterase
VIVVHGGPGTPGDVVALARGLADRFTVIEPFQRRSGVVPLTVAQLVADLHSLIGSRPGPPPAVVGFSWGAMLALAHGAAHPDDAAAMALIGCGTFDPGSRRQLHATVDARLDRALRERLERVDETIADPDERFRAYGALLRPVYSFDLGPIVEEPDRCDARGHDEAWSDMLRLQDEGVYPGAFAAIRQPVLMLHGAADPHPGPATRDLLRQYIPQLEYREWPECGHYPWLERSVQREFLDVLISWLSRGQAPEGTEVLSPFR